MFVALIVVLVSLFEFCIIPQIPPLGATIRCIYELPRRPEGEIVYPQGGWMWYNNKKFQKEEQETDHDF
jgi:hypothetical protein